MVVGVPRQGKGWDALPKRAFDRDEKSSIMVLRIARFNGQIKIRTLNDYMEEW